MPQSASSRRSKPAGAWTLSIRTRVSPRFRERVRDARRDEDEGARPGQELVLTQEQRQLALEDVERVVLRVVRVGRRPFSVRGHRDQAEVEPRRVLRAREKLHVADPMTLARTDDDCLRRLAHSGNSSGWNAYAHIDEGSTTMNATPSPHVNGLEP